MMHPARTLAGAIAAVLIAGASASAQQATQSPQSPPPPPAPRREAATAPVAPPLSVRPPASRPLLPVSQRTPTPGTVRAIDTVPGLGTRLQRALRGQAREVAAPAPTMAPASNASAPPPRVSRTVTTNAQPLVNASAAPPAGATMRCKDGTYLFGAASEDRCSGNGGLAIVLPSARPQPQAPRRP